MKQQKLLVVPLELKEANQFVDILHRHHKPVQGHRFSIGCVTPDNILHGAAIIGRPVARLAGHPKQVLEVTRLVTDGTPNACSILYAAAARVGKELGYNRIQTYILATEPGTSLKASGWKCEGEAGGGAWGREHRPRQINHPTEKKLRWAINLNTNDLPIIPERN